MSEIPLPKTDAERAKLANSLTRKHTLLGIFSFIFAILSVVTFVGVIVAVLVLEFSEASDALMYTLIGSFAGGSVLSAGLAYILFRFASRTEKVLGDFLERCDSEESFFVGEGTLATFTEEGLVIHATDREKKVHVPYREMRLFSACLRKKATERGEWVVILEVPARYVLKEGKASKNEPPMLIRVDMKPRLLNTIEARGLTLIGEQFTNVPASKAKFTAQKKYLLPNHTKHKRALISVMGGTALVIAAVLVGIFLETTVGSILGVFGFFLTGRGVIAFARARALLAFYAEGLLWQDSDRTESAFLKWEEVLSVRCGEQEGYPVLTVECAYSDYNFPRPAGAWEYLEETHSDKVK